MIVNPFSLPGRFYRGNLHTHTNRSDGALSPEIVIERYREAGYDFITISDHFLEKFNFQITDTTAFRRDDFATLIGAELHAPQTLLGDKWHILAAGLPLDFAPTDVTETGPDLARRARAAGAFVAIAHPHNYGLTPEDGRTIDAAHAVEIYNHTSWAANNRGDGWYLLDTLLTEGKRMTAIAVDDAHFKFSDFAGGWINVKAEMLSPDAILSALKDGAFYASQGPEIHDVEMSKTHVTVRCSPAERIVVSGRGMVYEHAEGPARTRATLPIGAFRKGGYFRIAVVDASRRSAWTNPFWFDAL